MDDRRAGSAIRAVRLRRGWRQVDLAAAAGVSTATVSRIEAGRLEGVDLGRVRRVARALDMEIAIFARWHGSDLDRLINARHSAMHEAVARTFAAKRGWQALPEVSFAIYGERGVVDVMAWHDETRSLLVVELKTEIVDIQELLGTLDRKRRLARQIVRDRGWRPETVSTWLVLADSRTNRRRVGAHRTVLRSVLPRDGRAVAGWLARPTGQLAALSFLPDLRATMSKRTRGRGAARRRA